MLLPRQSVLSGRFSVVVFDLDGTLLDSDAASAAPYVALGVPLSEVTYGHVVADECARLGLAVDDYVAAYDVEAAPPFAGVDDVVASAAAAGRCARTRCGRAERPSCSGSGGTPEVALFAEDFGGGPKRLGPVLDGVGLDGIGGRRVRRRHRPTTARAPPTPAVAFALAAWNPRAAAIASPGDVLLERPSDLLALGVPTRSGGVSAPTLGSALALAGPGALDGDRSIAGRLDVVRCGGRRGGVRRHGLGGLWRRRDVRRRLVVQRRGGRGRLLALARLLRRR